MVNRDNWKQVRLGDIFEISSGGTPSKKQLEYYENGTIYWVKTGDLKTKFIYSTPGVITEEGLKNSSAKKFPIGTTLIAMYGATIGACSILAVEAATNQACAAFLPNDDVYPEYFYLFLCSKKKTFVDMGVGGAQPNISATILKRFRIDLPPIEIQKQIAAILDKASELIELRKEQLEKMDLLIKSKFIAMFGDPVTNPMGWKTGIIRDIVSEVKYGTSKAAVDNGSFVYLRMNNITYDGHLDLSKLKYIDIPNHEVEKCIVRKGDVLFNRTNSKELVGKTCVFKEDIPMIIAGYIIRVRPNQYANSEYISAILNSKYGKKTLFEMCKSIVGQANINAQELQDIKINIPPIELQNEFAAFVDKVEQQKGVMQTSLAKLEINYKALMQQYFG